MQAQAPPRGLLSIGLVIDDLVILQKCLASQLSAFSAKPGSSEASRRLDAALAGYDSAQLRFSTKKTFRDSTQAAFWGFDCCGLVELTFKAVRGGTPQTIIRLSPELKSELSSFVCVCVCVPGTPCCG